MCTKDSKEEAREESFPPQKQTGRNSAKIVTHKPCTGCTAWDSSSGVVHLKGDAFLVAFVNKTLTPGTPYYSVRQENASF